MTLFRFTSLILTIVYFVGCSDIGEGPVLPSVEPPGTSRTVNEVTISLPELRANPGDTLLIPIRLTGYKNVGAISVTIAFDPVVMTLISTSDFPSNGVFTSTPTSLANSSGQARAAWFSVDGLGLPTELFFNLQVVFRGGTTPLRFTNKVSGSVVDVIAEKTIVVYYVDGRITSR